MLLAEILHVELGLVADLLIDAFRDTAAAWRSQLVNARRDIHSVAEHGLVGEDHVADVNPDAQAQLRILHQRCLQLACAIDRIDRAVKARQGAVADLADQSAVEQRQHRAQMLAMLAHCTQTLALVAAHERRVADDIAEHDRRQLARRIWREGIGRTRHRSLPFDSIGPKQERPGYYSGARHSAKPRSRLANARRVTGYPRRVVDADCSAMYRDFSLS